MVKINIISRHYTNHSNLRATTHDSQTLMERERKRERERETTLTRDNLSLTIKESRLVNQSTLSKGGQRWSNMLFRDNFWQTIPLQQPRMA